ncbi:MAG: hypothetical protein AVDCRST_MAG93-8098, partial [uncultured Chloroflexia bacterium]
SRSAQGRSGSLPTGSPRYSMC